MGREGLCAIGGIDGRPPETDPWFSKLFLSRAVGRSDAGRSGLWEPCEGDAGSGCDGCLFVHGRDDMGGNCEEILLTEVNVFQGQDAPVTDGGRGNRWGDLTPKERWEGRSPGCGRNIFSHDDEATSDPRLGNEDRSITKVGLYDIPHFGCHSAKVKDRCGTGVKSFYIFKNESGGSNEVDDVHYFGEKVSIVTIVLLSAK